MSYQHPWCARLLTPLPDEQTRGAVLADEPRWDYVETELVKLGSLAHGQVDLNAVAEACLGLLESRTKDMRVLAQLLRCLQHPAKATPMGAALSLLEAWIQAYWLLAWPGNASQKQRLMVQVVKRFEGALPRVSDSASAAELAQLLAQAEQLERVWLALCPDKGELLDPLLIAGPASAGGPGPGGCRCATREQRRRGDGRRYRHGGFHGAQWQHQGIRRRDRQLQ
ncbi:type VI secretion system ImpA family N-terminal domain-containing protein [Aeromonas rivipollensis]